MGTDVATTTRVDVAELLTAMLSVPSPSGEEDAMASLLVSRLLRAGFDVDVDAAGNVVAAWGDAPDISMFAATAICSTDAARSTPRDRSRPRSPRSAASHATGGGAS
jgi:hypothetical protein